MDSLNTHNIEDFAKRLKKIVNGDINELNIGGHYTGPLLNFACWLSPSDKIDSVKITRYLLEQGANPNIYKIYAPNYRWNHDDRFNINTHIYKFNPPLFSLASSIEFHKEYYDIAKKHIIKNEQNIIIKGDKFNIDESSTRNMIAYFMKLDFKHYINLITKTAILLAYGAKLKIKKNDRDEGNLDITKKWPKGKECLDFINEICKVLLKEESISKLDIDFIKYIKDQGANSTLVKNLIAKHKLLNRKKDFSLL